VRDGAGHGGQEVEFEPDQPAVRVLECSGRLPVLEVQGEVEPVTDDDVRAGLEAQRLEREERWI